MLELLELDKKENPEKYLSEEEKKQEMEMGLNADKQKNDKVEKKDKPKEEIVQAV